MKKTTFFLGFAFISMLLISSAACNKDDDANNFVNASDSSFLVKASFSNNAEVGAGGIAAAKGNVDSVKMFGGMMVSDHSKAQTSLDSIATFLNISTPNTPDAVHIAKAAYLQTLTGHTFDTAYINAQVIDHQATIAIFQQELSTGNDQFVKNFATSHLPIIEMHLQEALDIQAQLK